MLTRNQNEADKSEHDGVLLETQSNDVLDERMPCRAKPVSNRMKLDLCVFKRQMG